MEYNTAALRAFKSVAGETAQVNDLHAFCVPSLAKLQRKADVHFFPHGSEALAAEVTKAIQAALNRE